MEDLINQFKNEGYCCFSVSQDASLKNAVKEAESLVSHHDGIQVKWRHSSGKVKHLVNCHHSNNALRQLIQSKEIKKFCKAMFGNIPLFVTHSKISFKFKDINQTWLPHQDSSYKFFLAKPKGCAFAIHLDDINRENGALEIFPKTHINGRLKHRIKFVEGENEPQTEIIEMPKSTPVSIEGKIGTICAFDLNTLHQSGVNKIGGSRPIFIFEVEPATLFPFEYDGQDAVMINEEYFKPRAKILYPVVRKSLHLSDTLIRPALKKIIYQIYRLNH